VDLPEIRANLMNLNVSVTGRRAALDLSRLIDPAERRPRAEPHGTRPVWFDRWVETPIYWRDHLPLKIDLQGPTIIEQMDTTLVVDPGCRITSDPDGNLIVEVGQ
jgi:N-methylhydantoinase A